MNSYSIIKGVVIGGAFIGLTHPLSAHAADDEKTTYQDHALPIFRDRCLGCHNADKKKGDLDLSTYTAAMAGGASGAVLVAGDAGGSTLYKAVAHLQEPNMPLRGPRLPDAELATLKKWIEGGLLETAGSKTKKGDAPPPDPVRVSAPSVKPAGPSAMPEDLTLEPALRTGRSEAVTALAASPGAPLFAVGGRHQVLLYHADTLDLLAILPFPERRPCVLKFSRNGNLLLAGGGQGARLGRGVVWDVKTGDRLLELGDEYDSVLAADICRDQSHVALGGPGKLIKIYSTRDRALEHTIKKHADWVTALEFSPDGVLLATGDRSGGLHVWESHSGRLFYTLNGHKGGITDISWRDDSNVVATSSEDGQVMLWDMQNGQRVKNWQAHTAASSVRYAHDGRLITCGRDRFVRLWSNGAKQREFEAFDDVALQAILSHDGKHAIASDWTGEIRAWNAADGKRLGTLTANPPTLAERLAADTQRLHEEEAKFKKLEAQSQAAQATADKASETLAAAQKDAAEAEAAVKKVEATLAEANKTIEAVASVEADLRAKEAALPQKADATRKAVSARNPAAEDLVKLQEAAVTALKKLQEGRDDPEAEVKRVEAAQKAAADKAAEWIRLSDAANKARSEEAQAKAAVNALKKTLSEREAPLKQAKEDKTTAAAALAQAKKRLTDVTKAVAEKKKQAAAAADPAVKAREAMDAAASQAESLRCQITSWKAAQFNLQVHAARRESVKLQNEHDHLVAQAGGARRAAAEAGAVVKEAEKAAVQAGLEIKLAQEAVGAAQETTAKAKAALETARQAVTEREARSQGATSLAAQISEAAGQSVDNAILAAAAAKIKEAADLLSKDVEAARQAVTEREAESGKAQAAIHAAEEDATQKVAAADRASKRVSELEAAARSAAEHIGPVQDLADRFRPQLDAAKAKFDRLREEYLKLKPKRP